MAYKVFKQSNNGAYPYRIGKPGSKPGDASRNGRGFKTAADARAFVKSLNTRAAKRSSSKSTAGVGRSDH